MSTVFELSDQSVLKEILPVQMVLNLTLYIELQDRLNITFGMSDDMSILNFYLFDGFENKHFYTMFCPGCTNEIKKSPLNKCFKILYDFLIGMCHFCKKSIHIRVCRKDKQNKVYIGIKILNTRNTGIYIK
jgi:hypothetical protein